MTREELQGLVVELRQKSARLRQMSDELAGLPDESLVRLRAEVARTDLANLMDWVYAIDPTYPDLESDDSRSSDETPMTREELWDFATGMRLTAFKLQQVADGLAGLPDESLAELRDVAMRSVIMDLVDGLDPTYPQHEPGTVQLSELVGLNTSPGSEWDEVGDYHEDFQSEWGEDDDTAPDDYIP